MPIVDKRFANLPPHFKPDSNLLTLEEREDILPGYSRSFPTNFQEVLNFFACFTCLS